MGAHAALFWKPSLLGSDSSQPVPALGAAFPLLPGREERFRRFCTEIAGPRRQAFGDSQKRLGLLREHWFLQLGPSGPLVIMVVDGPDPARSLAMMGSSSDPFDVWVREEVKELFGVDMASPPPSLPELVVNYES
jgi:hypothetical protein